MIDFRTAQHADKKGFEKVIERLRPVQKEAKDWRAFANIINRQRS